MKTRQIVGQIEQRSDYCLVKLINRWTDKPKDRAEDRQTARLVEVQMDGRIDRQTARLTDGQPNKPVSVFVWLNWRTGEWMDRQID